MLKRLFELFKQMLLLTEETQRNKIEIKELRQEMKTLTEIVQRLTFEVQRISERETHEREKIMLMLENQLLRFERQLPLAKQDDDKKKTD